VFRNRIETLISDAVVEAENIVPEIRRSLTPVRSSADKSAGLPSVRTSNGVKRQSRAEAKGVGKTKIPVQELPAESTKEIGESLPLR